MKVRWAGQAQPPDVVAELQQDFNAQFGHPALAVAEVDRLLHDARPGVEQAVQQRHLKGITPHGDLLDVRGPQRVRPDRLEAGRTVAGPFQPGDPTRQPVAPERELPAAPAPALVDGAAGNVAAADRHVGIRRDAREKAAGIGRIVREVRVHLHHHLGAQRIQRMGDPPHVRGPQPVLPALYQVHPAITWGELPHQPAGAVRAFVVDHQKGHVRIRVQIGHAPQQQRDVAGLVVGGDHEAHSGPGVGCLRTDLGDHQCPLPLLCRGIGFSPVRDGGTMGLNKKRARAVSNTTRAWTGQLLTGQTQSSTDWRSSLSP